MKTIAPYANAIAALAALGLPPHLLMGGMTPAERVRGRFMRDGEGHPGAMSPEQISALIKSKLDEVKKIAETSATEVKNLGDSHGETKAAADRALTALGVLEEIKNRVSDLEQKATKPFGGAGEPVKNFGQQIAENEQFKTYVKNGSNGSIRLELKAITTAAGSAGGMIVSQRENEIVALPKRPDIIIRDLLTVVPITTGSVDYPKQTTRQNNVAAVPEGTTKPYSNYGWSRVTAPVRTLAHLAKLTRQAMDDAPRLQAEVDAEMRYGLAIGEDAQILNGDGTGENLLGLLAQATVYALPTGATVPASSIDKLRAAILQSVLAYYPADGIVLNPIDWFNIEITKDGQGRYMFANPLQMAGPTLWGRPVVATVSMAAGAFLTGAFKMAATLYDRLSVEVLISSENADDFEKNLLTMRAEERLALAVKRPAALIKGTF